MRIVCNQIPAAVLVGGTSKRMVQDKLLLPLGGELLLERVIKQLYPICSPLLIIGREYPLSVGRNKVTFLPDYVEQAGPLGGIASALRYAENSLHARWILIAAGDLGLLNSRVVRQLCQFQTRHSCDIVMPKIDDFPQPLFALYRTSLAGLAESLLNSGERRVLSLTEQCRVHYITRDELLLEASSHLLHDVDTPADYEQAKRYLEE